VRAGRTSVKKIKTTDQLIRKKGGKGHAGTDPEKRGKTGRQEILQLRKEETGVQVFCRERKKEVDGEKSQTTSKAWIIKIQKRHGTVLW